MTWIDLYNFLGVKDFVFFISDPRLQDYLFPVKLIFVTFAMFFLAFVVYFMINSSWLQYKFLEDTSEFFSWQAYGTKEMTKRWDKIKKRAALGAESDYKLAIIDADDFLEEVLDKKGYEGKDFKEVIEKVNVVSESAGEILAAHETRNAIVYNPDFSISGEQAKKILDTYESAIKNIGLE